MKWLIISASQRKNGVSHKISNYLSKQVETLGVASSILDLSTLDLDMWNETIIDQSSPINTQLKQLSPTLTDSTAIVIVVPEWFGTIPPALHNLLFLCTREQVGHKPALIATVSANKGGCFALNNLRSTSYKNNRICYIPEHLIIRDCNTFFENTYLLDRCDYAIKMLRLYDQSMGLMRKENTDFLCESKYAYGMS